jgi:hypothetical protein
MGQVQTSVTRPFRRRWRAIGGLLAGALASVTLGTPAQATIVERGQFADTFSDSYDDCGFTVDVEGSFSGQYRIREGKGNVETAFFFQQLLSWEETHSANGRSITLRGHTVTNEVRARHVEGSIFEFVTIEAGQPFAVYDEEGNLVLRDRGVIRFTFLWDTLGDDEPGGVFIEMLDIQFGGPHPSWDLDWSEICALLV